MTLGLIQGVSCLPCKAGERLQLACWHSPVPVALSCRRAVPRPRTSRGRRSPTQLAFPMRLVKVTPEVARVLGNHAPRLSAAFPDRSPPKAFRFGIGDIVSVAIFEAAAGGLFTSESGVRAGNFVDISNQAVDERGTITIPYAGSIRAKGRTPAEIQDEIVARLQGPRS